MSETTVKRYKHKSQRIGYEVDSVTTSRMGGMYEDPDGDYALASDYDALEAKYLEISQEHGALMFKAAGFPPVEWETERDALLAERKMLETDLVEVITKLRGLADRHDQESPLQSPTYTGSTLRLIADALADRLDGKDTGVGT